MNLGAHVSVPMYRRSLPQRLRLEGGRCPDCGVTDFPPRAVCVRCRGPLEAFVLSGRGAVVAATYITAAGAPPEFTPFVQETGGYWVAIVALDEGPRITAQLTCAGLPGLRVRAVIRRLYVEEGVIRYGFKFAPEEAGGE